jgi:hypothetical protein
MKKIRRFIIRIIGHEAYYSWFHFGDYQRRGDKVYFMTLSNFRADKIENNFSNFAKERDGWMFLLESKYKTL